MPWQVNHTNANRGVYWQGGQAKVVTHICYGEEGAKQKDIQADAQCTDAKVKHCTRFAL